MTAIARHHTHKTLDHSTYVAESVSEFLDYLLPSAEHWKSARRGDIAFRGQAWSQWHLLPRAFRQKETIGYELGAQTRFESKVTNQARAEFNAIHQFVVAADTAGLPVTESGSRLLLQENPRQIFDDPNWEHGWPKAEIVETLALAQHHGVPTRLLDFTEEPWVAAYVAASSVWEGHLPPEAQQENNCQMSVWAVDLRFIRSVNGISHRYPERIAEVRVPRANNSYLNAQFGFFLMDRGANDVMARGEQLFLDIAIVNRASFWNVGRRLARKGIVPIWFDDIPIRQVSISVDFTDELLKELANRGITKGSLMPSLDRIVESLEMQRALAFSGTSAAQLADTKSE